MRATRPRARAGEMYGLRAVPNRSRLSATVRGVLLATGSVGLWTGPMLPASAQLPDLDLSALDPLDGFRIRGEQSGDRVGISVSGAGDINGDGIDDLIIGADGAPNAAYAGAGYVVFGRDPGAGDPFPAILELSSLNASSGMRLDGGNNGDSAGIRVAGAGDINGDGIDDLIIGADGASLPLKPAAGQSYVVFGRNTAVDGDFPAIDLRNLTGANGFRLNGAAATNHAGSSVSGVEDVNGDGVDDLLIGARRADPNGSYSGASYVVFGIDTAVDGNFPGSVELSSLAGATGFQINGQAMNDFAATVSGAGDINGDGIDDLLVGARGADPSADYSGAGYVVFGRDFGQGDNFPAELEFVNLDGGNGFRANGHRLGDRAGASVSRAGDINGDGIDDLAIGAPRADGFLFTYDAGATYVVFGRDTAQSGGFSTELELSALNGANGFRVLGEAKDDFSGGSVAAAGDINGDGVDDLLIGAIGADPNSHPNGDLSGATYVVFGRDTAASSNFPASLSLSSLTASDGFRIDGAFAYSYSGSSVSGAGDINGDGADDVIIGAFGGGAGSSYIVFGGDLDGDGVMNLFDTDDDGDGVPDVDDAFPRDGTETVDSDGDGVGDNSDSAPFDPANTGLVITLPVGSFGSMTYGNGYGTDEHSSVLAAEFDWNGKGGRLVHVRGVDIDLNRELAYRINGVRGFLRRGPPNGPAVDSLIWLRPRDLAPGVNRITFEETIGDTWGVGRLGVFKEGEAFGNIRKNAGLKDTFHKKGFELHVHGKKPKLIKLAAWDNNRTRGGSAEVELVLNRKKLGSLPRGKKKKLGSVLNVYLPKRKLKDDNVLFIHNRIKNNTEWGVVLKGLFSGAAKAGRIKNGLKGTKRDVEYLIPVDRKKGRKVNFQYNDVDSNTELEIHIDGRFAKNAPQGKNKKWVSDTLTFKGENKPILVEVMVKTTTRKDRWGSRIKGWK